MSNEAANVAILKEAYRRWNDSKGGSVEHWFDSVVAPNISFGSVPRGAAPLEFAKQYDSREQLRGYFQGLVGEWTMQHYTVDEYIAAQPQAVRATLARVRQTIRKAVVDNDSLSTNAHNVKIITVDGAVTLRGPVKTAEEKATVEALAQKASGVKSVDNQLEVDRDL